MTTPQPLKPAPSQQGRTPQQSQHGAAATPGASGSTPYSNFPTAFSPHGPKSSPQQIKKSPATGTTGGTMMGNSQPAMNFDSPSAAAFNNMLGMGSFDPSLDNMAMGGIGLPRPNGDEERQKRLDDVIQILGQKKGLVSEEGLERLTKRVGLDYICDVHGSFKTLMIAGGTILLEIAMKDHIVQTVTLNFPSSGPSVKKHQNKAEAIILDNLKLAPDQLPWTKQLDDFAVNLEQLAILDKLSVIDKEGKAELVTLDAVAGIYESLEKVHDWDIKRLREEPGYVQKGDDYLRILAMCERSGLPVMHERGRVGMSLDYWREQRYRKSRDAGARQGYKDKKTWGIVIGCASMSPLVYQAPVRVSNKWIADEVELPAADGLLGPILNWQQPPDIVLPAKEAHDGDELMVPSGPRTPEVMFTAAFNPPVTLPYSVWEEMHHLTGATAHPPFGHPPTFDYLIFPPEGYYNASEPRMITARRRVKAFTKDKKPAPKTHENRLFIHKPIYGQTLTELPFSHPSQLVNMLPMLRQYAFLWNLLDNAFGDRGEKPAPPPASGRQEITGPIKTDETTAVTVRSGEFDAWMSQAQKDVKVPGADPSTNGTSSDEEHVKIDVTLNAHPQPNPKLQIMFPFRSRLAQITVDIERNGTVQVESTNIVNDKGQVIDEAGKPVDGSAPNLSHTKERLGRLLMFFEDIGLWCEWIRANVGA